jgi:hypothetical protein
MILHEKIFGSNKSFTAFKYIKSKIVYINNDN